MHPNLQTLLQGDPLILLSLIQETTQMRRLQKEAFVMFKKRKKVKYRKQKKARE